MEIIALKPTGFSSNCYIIHNGREAFVVDPSIGENQIKSKLDSMGLSLKAILLTHGHFDHIWRAKELKDLTGAPLWIHELDAEMLTDSMKNAFSVFVQGSFVVGEADATFKDSDLLTLGEEKIKVIHTPGHTKGSVCFDLGHSLITGDTIFSEGFGRYDLYGGDFSALKESLKKLQEMANECQRWIYCGHGETSTLKSATDKLKYYF